MLFPVLTIKVIVTNGVNLCLIETANIDAETVGVGARYIKRFDPATTAEKMLCGVCIEGVGGEEFLAFFQVKSAFGNDDTWNKCSEEPQGAVELRW